MLFPRLNSCTRCADIPSLLNDIDCRLTFLAKKEYNNIIFSLGYNVDRCVVLDLLNYKRILQKKICNSDYACKFSVENIASKIQILIRK